MNTHESVQSENPLKARTSPLLTLSTRKWIESSLTKPKHSQGKSFSYLETIFPDNSCASAILHRCFAGAPRFGPFRAKYEVSHNTAVYTGNRNGGLEAGVRDFGLSGSCASKFTWTGEKDSGATEAGKRTVRVIFFLIEHPLWKRVHWFQRFSFATKREERREERGERREERGERREEGGEKREERRERREERREKKEERRRKKRERKAARENVFSPFLSSPLRASLIAALWLFS